MSLIASITTHRFCVPLAEILTDAKHGDHTHFELVTASITTQDGITGTGYTYTATACAEVENFCGRFNAPGLKPVVD